MMAAWFVFESSHVVHSQTPGVQASENMQLAWSVWSVLVLTAIWAFAFHTIYLRDEPRVAASRWIFQNVPGPINVQIQSGGLNLQPASAFPHWRIYSGGPALRYFLYRPKRRDIWITSCLGTRSTSSTVLFDPAPDSVRYADSNPRAGSRHCLADIGLCEHAATHAAIPILLHSTNRSQLQADSQYYLHLEIDKGSLEISGATVANETDYDYTLPFRVDGYDRVRRHLSR